jgi:hypothetical protein
VNNDPAQGIAMLQPVEDSSNLRCFDQKRRFGIDFLYPVDRYVEALTSPTIADRKGEIIANPLFADPDPSDDEVAVRSPGDVFLAGLVGVPWQDIARDPAAPALGFKGPDELLSSWVEGYSSTWEIILGDPAAGQPPGDPHMIESVVPRSGDNPITGDEITPPGDPLNAINGSERSIPGQNDLQYACIFPLWPGSERDCSDPTVMACDCDAGNDSPLCAPNPGDNDERTLQVRAKAYPGLRELSVIQGLGSQGVVGSVCPVQIDDPAAEDFGYRPAVTALIYQLSIALWTGQ